MPFIRRAIGLAGKLLSHVRVVVRYSSAVLRIVLPMLHMGAAVDVDLASAPVDASTPKATTRRPAPEGITSAKGNSGRDDAAGQVPFFRVIIVRWIVRIWPFAIDDGGIIVRHVKGAGVRGLDGDDLLVTLLPDRDVLLFARSQLFRRISL